MLMMTTRTPSPEITPQLLTVEQTATMVGLGVRTIWNMVAKDEFPKPVKIGAATRWRRSEIIDWIDALGE